MKYYMCGVTFQWELGETEDIGYSESLEELKKRSCWEECGIVEIETDDPDFWKVDPDKEYREEPKKKYSSFRWVEPQNFKWGKK